MFVRIVPRIDLTETLKHTKLRFVGESYDPTSTSDPIYFDHPWRRLFVRVDPALYDELQSGRMVV
jgi:hypothetical protein